MRPARRPLPDGRPYMVRYCRYCGQPFPTRYGGAEYCSVRHQARQWRAIKRLLDTSPAEARA